MAWLLPRRCAAEQKSAEIAEHHRGSCGDTLRCCKSQAVSVPCAVRVRVWLFGTSHSSSLPSLYPHCCIPGCGSSVPRITTRDLCVPAVTRHMETTRYFPVIACIRVALARNGSGITFLALQGLGLPFPLLAAEHSYQ